MSALPLPIAVLLCAGVLLVAAGIAAVLADHRARRRSASPRKCVRCGCTDAESCPGGCWWISFNPLICSRCE